MLFLNAFWSTDPFTSLVVREFTLDNFVELVSTAVYRTVTLRTVGMAALVTGDVHRPGLPDRLLHGQGRFAADARRPRRRRAHAAVGELPHQGLLVAPDPVRGRRARLAAQAARAGGSGLRRHRHLADVHLSLAAVHDPADLRRPRADPQLAARGVGRPRRPRLDDVPPGHRADVDPGRRRRLDLHVLADARRLHRARARLDDPVHRQRHRHQRRLRTCRSPPPTRSSRWSIILVYLLIARRLGAFEAF